MATKGLKVTCTPYVHSRADWKENREGKLFAYREFMANYLAL